MEADCIFCRIATRSLSAPIVFENDQVVAFRDVNPQAPTHILVIPKKHIVSLDETTPGEQPILGALLYTAKTLAEKEGLSINGYRVVINQGANAGQTVFHLHVHLLGGRSFSWPPG